MPHFLRTMLLLLLLLPGPAGAGTAAPAPGTKPVVLTFFWGKGCPHCEDEKRFLGELKRRYPSLTVRDYEVWKDRVNAAFYQRVLQAANIRQAGVPGTVVGTTVFLGFNERSRKAIADAVAACSRTGCPDAVSGSGTAGLDDGRAASEAIRLPVIGTVDPEALSLPALTIVIAGLDSFNPCAFFVLLFLLSLLAHVRSRKRMLLIGGIFVLSSGAVYFLFMAAWLNLFMVTGRLPAITLAGGVIAILIGAVNVKDFFLFKEGISLSIPERAKPRLFERMRSIVRASSLPAMAGGAVVLALAANVYELLCTAGFPMVYTRMLTLRSLTTAAYYRYLAFYNIVYVVPLAVIVAMITATLGARKLTERQGRQLKLLSGLMMASLGVILIVEPGLLNNVLASVGLLGGVIVVSAVIIAIMKRVRPEIAT